MKRKADLKDSLPSKKLKKDVTLLPRTCFWHETVPEDTRDVVRSFLDPRSLSALACASPQDMQETGNAHQEMVKKAWRQLREEINFSRSYKRFALDVAFGNCTKKFKKWLHGSKFSHLDVLNFQNVAALFGQFELLLMIRAFVDEMAKCQSDSIERYAARNGHCNFLQRCVAEIPRGRARVKSAQVTTIAIRQGHVDILRYQNRLGVTFTAENAKDALHFAKPDILDFLINICGVVRPTPCCGFDARNKEIHQPQFDDESHLKCLLLFKDLINWHQIALEALFHGHDACLGHALTHLEPTHALLHAALSIDNVGLLAWCIQKIPLEPAMLSFAMRENACKCIEFLSSAGVRITLDDLWSLYTGKAWCNHNIGHSDLASKMQRLGVSSIVKLS